MAGQFKRRWQITSRTLMLFVLSCAAVLAVYLISRDRVGRWLFRVVYVAKTEFAPQDVRRFEDLVGVRLPPNATIDLATVGGHRDHVLTVRIQMPVEEATEFRQRLQMLARPTNISFLGTLQNAAPQLKNVALQVDSAFQVGDAEQVIVCKPENGRVIVYFEAYDCIGPEFHEIWDMFSLR